jgi:hypothetical protein
VLHVAAPQGRQPTGQGSQERHVVHHKDFAKDANAWGARGHHLTAEDQR